MPPLLSNLSNTFWSYVSPRKTQQRRDKPFKAPPALRKPAPKIDPRSMSPETRVNNWKVGKTPSATGSIARNMDGLYLQTPSASHSGGRSDQLSPDALERTYTDLEGDTMIDDLIENLSDEDAFDANDETVVVDESQYEQKDHDPEAEQRRREAQARDLRAAGWSEHAISLFQKLGMRGFEPLMPSDWNYDFPMMPPMMFTKNRDRAFIKPMYAPNYHAQKALKALLELGARVRDAILQNVQIRTAEERIKRGVQAYNKWALRDGHVDHSWNLSIFDVAAGGRKVPTSILQSRMLRKLERLADRWKDAFRVRPSVEQVEEPEEEGAPSVDPPSEEEFSRELPTLYGVIVSHTVFGFVSYDIQAMSPSLRTVAIFDYGQADYDVWNGLAIAIFVLHCRNRMLELKDDLPEFSSSDSEDPDL